jgi:hypothetical protein
MTLTIEQQSDAAILNIFHSMEEGAEYVLNDYWFAETNRMRKENCFSQLKHKQECKYVRKGEELLLNKEKVFDFTGKSNLSLAIGDILYAFTFSFPSVLALEDNGLEKLKSNTCDGKVVEIDGKKYKLTAV